MLSVVEAMATRYILAFQVIYQDTEHQDSLPCVAWSIGFWHRLHKAVECVAQTLSVLCNDVCCPAESDVSFKWEIRVIERPQSQIQQSPAVHCSMMCNVPVVL